MFILIENSANSVDKKADLAFQRTEFAADQVYDNCSYKISFLILDLIVSASSLGIHIIVIIT